MLLQILLLFILKEEDWIMFIPNLKYCLQDGCCIMLLVMLLFQMLLRGETKLLFNLEKLLIKYLMLFAIQMR